MPEPQPLTRTVAAYHDHGRLLCPTCTQAAILPITEGAEYDGEHPLLCADVRCETWVVDEDDAPRAGTVFFTASYAGPLNPYLQQGWVGYDGAPFELAAGDQGGLAPRTITLTLSTEDEGATGG